MVNNLVKGCRLWDKITEKMNRGNYSIPAPLRSEKLQWHSAYQEGDYSALKCKITGKYAEVIVGDAEDHKSRLDLNRKVLEYYDPDAPTSLGVADLLRSVGLKCQVQPRGVRCSGMTSTKAIMVFRALAMIPSMDRRLEWCRGKGYTATECRKMELAFFEDGPKKEK